jgi:hypothetical protein
LPALDNLLRDLPMIGIDPLDQTGPAQRLQSADMGADISLGVPALPPKLSRIRSRCRLGR